MKLYIDSKSPLHGIQKQFNAYYPFLKLEFFKNQSYEPETQNSSKVACESVKNMFSKNKEGIINIEPVRTVAQVENDFEKDFGLSVQIYRRSGNVWIETSLTDDWTLEKQNKEGEQISSHFSARLPKDSRQL